MGCSANNYNNYKYVKWLRFSNGFDVQSNNFAPVSPQKNTLGAFQGAPKVQNIKKKYSWLLL